MGLVLSDPRRISMVLWCNAQLWSAMILTFSNGFQMTACSAVPRKFFHLSLFLLMSRRICRDHAVRFVPASWNDLFHSYYFDKETLVPFGQCEIDLELKRLLQDDWGHNWNFRTDHGLVPFRQTDRLPPYLSICKLDCFKNRRAAAKGWVNMRYAIENNKVRKSLGLDPLPL